MPSDTFYRLPAEKRCRLTNAILAELKRVPFSKFSINRIVQQAEIPRGSYYQYFSGSADLLAYVLQDYNLQSQNRITVLWQEKPGDLYALFSDLYDHTVSYGLSEEYKDIFFNLFSELRICDLCSMMNACKKNDPPFQNILEKELSPAQKLTYEIMTAVLADALARTFTQPQDAAEIKADFLIKLNALNSLEINAFSAQ